MRATISGTCVAARPARANQDGSPSKYVDVKLLVGETVVKAWAFADSLVEAHGGALPPVGAEVALDVYVEARAPKDGGKPYLSSKAVSYSVVTPAAMQGLVTV